MALQLLHDTIKAIATCHNSQLTYLQKLVKNKVFIYDISLFQLKSRLTKVEKKIAAVTDLKKIITSIVQDCKWKPFCPLLPDQSNIWRCVCLEPADMRFKGTRRFMFSWESFQQRKQLLCIWSVYLQAEGNKTHTVAPQMRLLPGDHSATAPPGAHHSNLLHLHQLTFFFYFFLKKINMKWKYIFRVIIRW